MNSWNVKSMDYFISACLIAVMAWALPAFADEPEDMLTTGPIAKDVAVSNDGTQLAFAYENAGSSAIWVSDRNGKNAHKLLDWPGSDQVSPDWSPDGQSIVFSSNKNSSGYDIWVVNVSSLGATQLTSNSGSNEKPRYSPDGSKVLFTSNRTGKREIWYMNADGTGQKAVGLQSLIVDDPAWSPDGTEVVFSGCTLPESGSSLSDGHCNLFVIALDASTARQVTFGNAQDWEPDWGTGGIVFSSSRSDYNLMVVDPAGNNLHQVTDKNELCSHPRWNPSTGEVLFQDSDGAINKSTLAGSVTSVVDAGHLSTAKKGDLNYDGCVDRSDYDLLMNAVRGMGVKMPAYDLNADGVVNRADARTLVGLFSNPRGEPCQ